MAEIINLNATTPPAPASALNVEWQKGATSGSDPSTGLPIYPTSAYLPKFTGDTGGGGTLGLVPAPAAGDAAAGKVLKADGTWYVPPSASSIITTEGDLIVGGVGGTPERLAAGGLGQVLTSGGAGIVPSWTTPSSGGVPGLLISGSASPFGLSLFQSLTNIGASGVFPNAVKSGSLLIVAFGATGTVDPLTVTDTLGTVYTKMLALTGNLNNLALYAGISSAAGVNTVTIAGGSTSYPMTSIAEFGGVQAVVDVSATVYNGSTTATLSLTTAFADDLLLFIAYANHSACVFTFGDNFTLMSQANGADAQGIAYQFGGPAGGISGACTISGGTPDNSPMILIAFKATSTTSPGSDGDFYLDTYGKGLYGPRTSGAWPLIGHLT